MRSIGKAPDPASAQKIGDLLLAEGIENEVEDAEIWVFDDDRIDEATELFASFRHNPDDRRLARATKVATAKRQEEKEEQKSFQRRLVQGDKIFQSSALKMGTLTAGLMAVSVLVTLLTEFGRGDKDLLLALLLTESAFTDYELWRVITPIFVHYGFLHIAFNMIWLKDLGSSVEHHETTWFLGLFVLVAAAGSNIAQYYDTGTGAGGMSGVVYALLGYIWMRSRIDSLSGYVVSMQMVAWMLGWLVICYTGYVGHIANTAHVVGLVIGVAWGAIQGTVIKNLRAPPGGRG